MSTEQKSSIIYGLNDRPPFLESVFAALQHLFAIFVAIMTPPLIIASQMGLDIETTSFLVSMALFASGVSTFIQCRRFGSVGTGLLCIQGTSYSFIGPIITAGMSGGLAVVFGSCMAASVIEIFIGRILRYARKVVTPLVSGIVVTLIGLCLIKVGISSCGGGTAAMENGTFGALHNLGLAALVLAVIVFFNSRKNRFLRMSSIVIGLAVGYVVSWILGYIDFDSVKSFGGVYLPIPFKYGIDFDLSAFISLSIIFIITAIEAYGDITANSMISGEPVEGDLFMKRASGGVVANGVSSFLSSMLNSFPNSIFAQNNGMIQLTGVASRHVGYYISAMLILLSIFPAVSLVFSLMPEAVLGGATLLMFGTVAASGIKVIASQKLGRKEILVLAISLAGGLSVEFMPEILSGFPEQIRSVFSSGITTGGLLAIFTNLAIRMKNEE